MTEEDEISPDPKAIKVLYDEISNQYCLVSNSLDSLNNKAIGILAFNGTLLSLSSLSIVQLLSNISFLFALGVVISYFNIITSAFFCIKAYKVIGINGTNAKNLLDKYYFKNGLQVMSQLCSNIAGDTERNRDVSVKKADYINLALKFTLMGMIIITLSLIIGFFGQ